MTETAAIAWPVKTREVHNHTMNSERWNFFHHRADDIVVVSAGKSGTTWVQWIAAQLVHGGPHRAAAGAGC